MMPMPLSICFFRCAAISNTARSRRTRTVTATSTPSVREWCLGGARRSGADLYEALGQIGKMKAALLAAFEGWDYVIAPTLPVVNFPAEEPGVSRQNPLEHTLFTAMFNQTCQPGVHGLHGV